nr:MAG TPA: hypothetical protein [Caudoviricetes sp.]DAX53323.1 MAG TPA: hypothetical protein [Caudoviricetes sp.]DAX94295.1 MAG TPA: hypothetical protein [Caudoviricetes sp.]
MRSMGCFCCFSVHRCAVKTNASPLSIMRL